jgi:hypothetical protein
VIAEPRAAPLGTLGVTPSEPLAARKPRARRFGAAQLTDWLALAFLVLLIVAAIAAEHLPGLASPTAPVGDFSQAPMRSVAAFSRA